MSELWMGPNEGSCTAGGGSAGIPWGGVGSSTAQCPSPGPNPHLCSWQAGPQDGGVSMQDKASLTPRPTPKGAWPDESQLCGSNSAAVCAGGLWRSLVGIVPPLQEPYAKSRSQEVTSVRGICSRQWQWPGGLDILRNCEVGGFGSLSLALTHPQTMCFLLQ